MAVPMSALSPEKLNSIARDEDEITWHDPPSSPFQSFVEHDQENIAPADPISTPSKPVPEDEDLAPQSAFKIHSPLKLQSTRSRMSPTKISPTKNHRVDMDQDDGTIDPELKQRETPPKQLLAKEMQEEVGSKDPLSISKRTISDHLVAQLEDAPVDFNPNPYPVPVVRAHLEDSEATLRENEGLTVAMKIMETRSESHEISTEYTFESQDTNLDDTSYDPDGPELTSLDIDDTRFSTFSEMPNLDMTKFAVLRQSPSKTMLNGQVTPRARPQLTPGTVRRTERTPSPTARREYKENDTTNLLLDFTAQIESFSTASRRPPGRGRHSPSKGGESGLLSYIQNQRSPAKGGSSFIPTTPGEKRQVFNLLDFELPPPPTPRSVPTVTIRELESLKSSFQSQISSLSASLSGKEAEVESLVKAVSDAERRVGEAQEALREERSAREHAEAQMADWKKKGEEVQKLLQDVQANLNRNDEERETLMQKLAAAEHRAEEAETRASEADARAIEAESKIVDTTMYGDSGREGSGKRFSEEEVQNIVSERINEVARDLHAAYKAKHEKKIAALKGNYQRKSDDKIKEYKEQIKTLERQLEEVQNSKDNTFSKVLPVDINTGNANSSNAEDKKRLEEQQAEIQNQKARLAGLTSELTSLRKSHADLLDELELERVEKGELVAAAEQMLALCNEKMESQQEQLRKSQIGVPPPPTGSSVVAAGTGSRIGQPSGLRGPGFGANGPSHLIRSSSNGAGKSRLMSNIERMGAMSAASNHGEKE